jgi:hypothetical protein
VTKAHQIDVIAQPQIAAAPTTVTPGGSVTVTGGDFGLGSAVKVSLGGAARGTGRAGAQGAFTLTITIPSATPAGTHKLIGVGSDGRRAAVSITVS